jgi:P27 family predicted phage terminase small subunit
VATYGPPPKPTALRLVEQGGKLRGRFAKRARTEPVAKLGLPPPPEHLTAQQVELWKRIEATAPPGLFTEVDGDLVDGYVQLLSMRTRLARMLAVVADDALMQNPLLRELRAINAELVQMQGQLGYSPAARTRIAVQPSGKKDDPRKHDDPVARFFGNTSPTKK